ncbi:four helix bundle protein [Daejeonella lutea]|uniref:Four helix bundle protein n=1 Tax=Daejeonella lutea TaxID=572036 RepID=A0A1T5ECX9_9SPHI|nr:four helix bundle protein [Daejeonella lutea]SKB81872.1 four helix bundle protein [Daejeonella lutea]
MHNFKNLTVWQRSIDLTTEIYSITREFPADEKYSLTSQIRRAAVSIPSNIAEGAGRKSNKEFKNFLSISTGSIFELETQIIIAHRLNFIDQLIMSEIIFKISEIQKMLFGLEQSIKVPI